MTAVDTCGGRLCDLKSVKCKLLHYGYNYNMTVGSTKLDSKSRNTKLTLVYLQGGYAWFRVWRPLAHRTRTKQVTLSRDVLNWLWYTLLVPCDRVSSFLLAATKCKVVGHWLYMYTGHFSPQTSCMTASDLFRVSYCEKIEQMTNGSWPEFMCSFYTTYMVT
jgi:hypothetical protein